MQTLYVITCVLAEITPLGCTLSKSMAEFQRDEINRNGGIGFHGSEVWIEEYPLAEDNYIEFE